MAKAADVSRLGPQAQPSMCDGKKGFATASLARKVLDRCNRSKVRGRSVYRCLFCHEWHMGNTTSTAAIRKAANRRKSLDQAQQSDE